MPYQWKGLPFGFATAPRDFTSLTKPILFLCHHKGLHIVIYLDDILVLVHSKQAGKRACLFLCSLLVRLGLHINFSKLDLGLSQSFTFLGLCWDTVCMSVSLPPDKLAEIQQLALSLLWTPHLTVHKVMCFLGKANFSTNGHSQLQHLCHVIQSDMLSVYHSPTQLFSCVHFSLSSLHQLEWLSNLQQSPVPLQLPLPDVVIAFLTGFPVSLDQHCMVPPPPLMLRDSGGVLGSVSVPQQQPPSSMPPLAYANYAMGSPQVGFFFRVEPPSICILYMSGVHSGVFFLLLGAKLDAVFTYGDSTVRVCTLATLWSLSRAGICATWCGQWSTPGLH